jgi:hypothetical protein
MLPDQDAQLPPCQVEEKGYLIPIFNPYLSILSRVQLKGPLIDKDTPRGDDASLGIVKVVSKFWTVESLHQGIDNPLNGPLFGE